MTAVSNNDFEYDYVSDCLNVRVFGRNFITEKETIIQTIAALFHSRPIKAAYVDIRAVPGPFTFNDRVHLGELAAQHLRGTPIAVVMTEEQADPERIGTIVARNRGANVEVFLDETEAKAWVQKYLTSAS